MKHLPFKKSLAFIIANNDYLHLEKLNTAVNDGKTLGEILETQQGFEVHYSFNLSKAKLKDLFINTIKETVKEGDRLLFYFAGHGIATEGVGTPQGYIMPVDASWGNVKSYISMRIIRSCLNEFPCKHILLILDCCFAGSFKWANLYRFTNGYIPKRIYKERYDRFIKDPARQVITSSAYDQLAIDVTKGETTGKRNPEHMQHSPFAQALIDGLNGAADIIPADGGDGLITATELYLYLRQQVETNTILHDEKTRQTPRLFALPRHNKGEFIFFNPNHRLNLPSTPAGEPYKGLRSFGGDDEDYFYGRDEAINEVLDKLNRHNLVVVTGASGTGKSSLVNAGVIPRLKEDGYTILPIISPVESINLRRQQKNVLVMDQYEELISQFKDSIQFQQFIQLLRQLLKLNRPGTFKIIITVRDDFLPHLDETLNKMDCQAEYFPIPPLSVEQMREIILKPAIQDRLFFEPDDLVEDIIHDLTQAPGALPLLSFTLSALYKLSIDNNRHRSLHLEDYKTLGRVTGIMMDQVRKLYKKLDKDHKRTIKNIFMRMVTLENRRISSRPLLINELSFLNSEENIRVKTIIKKLEAARLIVICISDKRLPCIEIAHTGLFSQWQLLLKCVQNEGKENMALRVRLSEDVMEGLFWNKRSRLKWLQRQLNSQDNYFNITETRFAQESIKRRKQKIRRIVLILIFAIIVFSGLTIGLRFFQHKARDKAKESRAGDLLTRAQLETDSVKAAGLARESYKLHPSPNTMRILTSIAATTITHPFYNLNLPHSGPVILSRFSPSSDDGMFTISSGNTGNTLNLWGRDGSLLNSIYYKDGIYFARYSPDGSQLLSIDKQNKVILWSNRGKRIKTIPHRAVVTSARFSSDGRYILTACEDHTVNIWNTQTHDPPTRYFFKSPVMYAGFSPRNKKILAVTHNREAILWNLNRNRDRIIINHVRSARFTPSGKRILGVDTLLNVRLWNLEGTPVSMINAKEEKISPNKAIISPDQRYILITTADNRIHITDIHKNLSRTFQAHQGFITSVSFSYDSRKFLTVSDDKTAVLWDLNGYRAAILDKHKQRINHAAFSADGTKIITSSNDNSAKVWDLNLQPALQINENQPGDKISNACFSPGGTVIAACINFNTLGIWNLNNRKRIRFQAHTQLINQVLFSPDGTKIITASEDASAKMWDPLGNQLLKLNRHTKPVNWVQFSADGKYILTASDDNTAKLWNLKGRLLANLDIHTKAVNRAIFSPSGKYMLTASQDGTAKLWNTKSCIRDKDSLPVSNFNIHTFGVDFAIFSPESDKVLTLAVTARLWKLDGTLMQEYAVHTGRITSAVFAADGASFFTSSQMKVIKQWDLQGNLIKQFTGHGSSVPSIKLSPRKPLLLTASHDKTVKLWDFKGNILADFNRHPQAVNSVDFSADGTKVLSTSRNRILLWYTPAAFLQWLESPTIPTLEITN